MPPKSAKRRSKDKAVPAQTERGDVKPKPPNIFLYVQLAKIKFLPGTLHMYEIHLRQGDALIMKCDETQSTDGVILQKEFDSKPTYTLIFQQDNVDRINHAADNPLLILLYLRKMKPGAMEEEEEGGGNEATDAESTKTQTIHSIATDLSQGRNSSSDGIEVDELNFFENEEEKLVLLCVGYIDLVKLFGHHRAMIHEELYLYPIRDLPNELRHTVHTEWHLYTLLPIAKTVTFANLAFVSLESIYNLKIDEALEIEELEVALSFRSTWPIEKNEYYELPWCSFRSMVRMPIREQNAHFMFECFRSHELRAQLCNAAGLKSTMGIELHKIFRDLLRSEKLEVDYEYIDLNEDSLIINSFHRYLMTMEMSKILQNVLTYQQYVIVVTLWHNSPTAGATKLYQGEIDPSILLYPSMETMRFAVGLEYVGPKMRTSKRPPQTRGFSELYPRKPMFAIVKICLMGPLGEVFPELKVFHETFVNQNRLLYCDVPYKELPTMGLCDIQRDAYLRFDKLINDTITYIHTNDVSDITERKGHFCCTIQNLENILMRVVGSDFNTRVPTKTNVEFSNLCAIAYNELEDRFHDLVLKAEESGVNEINMDETQKMEFLIDHINTMKILRAVGDERMENFIYNKIKSETFDGDLLQFYLLINHMEYGEFDKARSYFESKKKVSSLHEYFSNWILLYLDLLVIRSNPDSRPGYETEWLLKALSQFSERYASQPEGWILLYCYYVMYRYEPGAAFARWKFQELLARFQNKKSHAPFSVWGYYLNVFPQFPSELGHIFFDVSKTFIRMGLYEFGKIIFSAVENECRESDRFLVNSTFNILLQTLEPKLQPRNFNFDNSEEGKNWTAFNAQANGNMEYYRQNVSQAAAYYQKAVNMQRPLDDQENDNYILSTVRLAYLSYNSGDYSTTVAVLSKKSFGQLMPIIYSYMIGKAYYKMDDLQSALYHFTRCCTWGTHVPDVWGFLALINLRLGNNFNAIECWKYAKIDPTKFIDDEIYEELGKIDFDSVELYVDECPKTASNQQSPTMSR